MTPEAASAPTPTRELGVAELAVIIPTLNEYGNVAPLVERLDRVLADVAWEAIFVDDDSTDRTREAIYAIARRDPRVRSLHRIGRRGLASACIEGALASSAPYIAVIDADMQHDESLLPEMLRTLKSEPLDIVIGSRYVAGGGMGELSARRVRISGLATRLGRRILRAEIADPMSGFFMVRRDAFDRAVRNLSAIGFKILMDLFASSPEPLRFKELAYEFRRRAYGDSKLDSLVVWEYVMLVGDKLVGHIVPVRFLSFALVGGIGLVVHLGVLGTSLRLLGFPFEISQAAATLIAMVCNFTLNNVLTYRDLRLRGWGFLRGLVSFFLVCAAGAVANVGVGTVLFDTLALPWWAAGIAGAVVGAVWNYAVSGVFTWRKRAKA
ncbi:MAG TPA: glycosyltransferase family 2 protein [Stellaceae bacterium]|nr:glycosyltransferase family 2 protein [Stellaceae bacterium]